MDFVARQAHNQRWSAALVAVFILFFLFIGATIDHLYFDAFTSAGPTLPIATIFSLGFATLTTLTAYYGGSDIILSSLGAEKLNLRIPEHRELHNIVTEMALASGSAMPRVYVIFDPAPNALATGSNEKNAAICVTTGLLTLLDREETQGVVAHEISHIRNEDILLMTLVSILLGGIAILADWGRRGFYSSRSGRHLSKKNPLVFIPLLILIALSPLIARLLAMGDRGKENIWRMPVPPSTRATRAAWRKRWKKSAMRRCLFIKRRAARRIYFSSIRCAGASTIGTVSWPTCSPAIRRSLAGLRCFTEWPASRKAWFKAQKFKWCNKPEPERQSCYSVLNATLRWWR